MARQALCIGVNDYPGTSLDLSGCVNDARDWAAALKKRGFQVQMLLDQQATGLAIRKAIRTLVNGAKTGDSLVITFSGHGTQVEDRNGDEPDGTDEAICPRDTRTKGPITDDELFELYSDRDRGVRLFVISDSCFSGSVSKFAPMSTPPTTRGRSTLHPKVKFLPPATFLSKSALKRLGARRRRRAASPPGRYAGLLMSACQDTEESWDTAFRGRPNGAFTYVALRALEKLGPRATYRDWHKAVCRSLPSQQYPQTPELYGSSSMKKWRALA
jgi:metacaspase-1